MSEANTKEFWKELFFRLSNNKQPDDQLPLMWAQFKTSQLNRSDIEAAIESFKNQLEDNVKAKLDKLLEDTSEAQLLDLMKRCSLLGDVQCHAEMEKDADAVDTSLLFSCPSSSIPTMVTYSLTDQL
jgi:hypothetical protein